MPFVGGKLHLSLQRLGASWVGLFPGSFNLELFGPSRPVFV